jgi:hypothetical protein
VTADAEKPLHPIPLVRNHNVERFAIHVVNRNFEYVDHFKHWFEFRDDDLDFRNWDRRPGAAERSGGGRKSVGQGRDEQ